MDMEALSQTDLKNISSAKVLIVDDNKHNQELFSKFLQIMDISDIKCADDGMLAIDMMTKEDFDLIILDVVMPNMNGEEFLYKIRSVPQFKDVPVIVQTGNDSLEAKEAMFKAGGTDFVTKPVSPMEFFSRVRVHLENKMLIKKLNSEIKKMSDNMSLVKKMQESLYPDKLKVDGFNNIYNLRLSFNFDICNRIGGNFWELTKVDDTKFLMVFGEASGYGIPTSMNILRTKTLMDDIDVPKNGEAVGKYMSEINERLQPLLLRGQYVAMICIFVDTEKNKLYYSNAGYQSPLCKNNDGALNMFTYKANPLGIAASTTYVSETIDFEAGNVLFIYGNFIINGKNKNGETLGIEGIKQQADKHATLDSFISWFKSSLPENIDDDLTAVTLVRL